MFEFAKIREELGQEATIVFVSGNFNVLHPGHIRMIRYASQLGKHLVVGVNPDSHPGVDTPLGLRLEGVRSNRYVTCAVSLDGSVEDAILALRPQTVVKGHEHEGLFNAEQKALDNYDGKLVFSSGDFLLSTLSGLYENGDPLVDDVLPQAYLKRHGIAPNFVSRVLGAISGTRVLVIGDLIVDEYVDCDPLGMSQEDPTIVVTPVERRQFVGGAGIVAAHAKGLGAEVCFLSAVGKDDTCEFARQKLDEYGVLHVLLEDSSRQTTLKKRYRARGKSLLRVSHLTQHPISPELVSKIQTEVAKRIDEIDVILFSDFNYGCLPDALVCAVSKLANKHGVVMAADSQASSQLSDITRFRDMMLITPTELEARLALKDRTSGLVVIGDHLLEASGADHAIITLGSDGLMVFNKEDTHATDQIPALNKNPRDVAGAGDSLFCSISLAMTKDCSIWEACLFGAVAASHQVSRIGNEPIRVGDLLNSNRPAAL